MSGGLVSVRLDAEAIAAIDGRVGSRGRSGFIRDAVLAALKGSTALVEKPIAAGPVSVMGVGLVYSPPEPDKPSRVLRAVAEASSVRRPLTAAERAAADLRSDKMQTLLAALRGRAMTARDAAALLGWSELLVAKVADKLVAAGLVHFPRGAGVMEAK